VTAVSTPHLDAALRIELCRESDVPALMEFIATECAPTMCSGATTPVAVAVRPVPAARAARAGPDGHVGWLDGHRRDAGLTGFDLNVFGSEAPRSGYRTGSPLPRTAGAMSPATDVGRADLGLDAVATLGANEVSAKLLARLGLESIGSLARWVGVFDVARPQDSCATPPPRSGVTRAASLCAVI